MLELQIGRKYLRWCTEHWVSCWMSIDRWLVHFKSLLLFQAIKIRRLTLEFIQNRGASSEIKHNFLLRGRIEKVAGNKSEYNTDDTNQQTNLEITWTLQYSHQRCLWRVHLWLACQVEKYDHYNSWKPWYCDWRWKWLWLRWRKLNSSV